MRELAQLGQFVRLADYLFVEAVMATAVVNVEELLGVLTAHKQQVGRPWQRDGCDEHSRGNAVPLLRGSCTSYVYWHKQGSLL